MEDLTPRQQKAIVALIAEASIADAAKSCGVGETTLYRWLQGTDFKAAYRAARAAILETATTQLQQATGAAVEALTRNLTCGRSADEIRAAGIVLAMAYKSSELEDLAGRIEVLESLLLTKLGGK